MRLINPILYNLNVRGFPLNHLNMLNAIMHISFTVRNNPSLEIITLQEFVYGKRGYYKNILMNMLQDWEIVEPLGYLPDINWRSAINIVLIKKGTWNYNKLKITNNRPDLDFDNLYNYVYLEKKSNDTETLETFYLLNLHCLNRAFKKNMPEDYVKGRLKLADHLWSCIHQEMIVSKGDTLITADFNSEKGDSDFNKITAIYKDTFFVNQRWKYTYVSPNRKNHRYDHILGNFGNGVSVIDGRPLALKISDHAGLFYYAG